MVLLSMHGERSVLKLEGEKEIGVRMGTGMGHSPHCVPRGPFPTANLTMVSDSEDSNASRQESGEEEDVMSEGSSDEDEEANVKVLEGLASAVQESPYDYEAHKRYVKALRQKGGPLECVREAREGMHSLFPWMKGLITLELWLEWVEDESSIVETPEEYAAVDDLFRRALQDYQSVPLWMRWIVFKTDHLRIEEESERNKLRDWFEEAITSIGLHLTQGKGIWDSYIAFERRVLEEVPPNSPEERRTQVNRIHSIYRRMLSVPLQGMESGAEEYRKWNLEQGGNDTDLPPMYVTSLKMVEERQKWEERIVSQDPSGLLAAWKDYIAFERAKGDLIRSQCIYERAVKQYPHSAELWYGFTEMMDSSITLPITLDVHARAVRNLPYDSGLWCGYLRALERHACPLGEIEAVYQRALAVAFAGEGYYRDILVTYCDSVRRHAFRSAETDDGQDAIALLEKTFSEASAFLAQNAFGSDLQSYLQQYLARIMARPPFNNMTRAREIWEDIIKAHGKEYAMWLEYAKLEIQFGSPKDVRRIFKRAIATYGDWPEKLCEEWITFEREQGAFADYDAAYTRVRVRQKEIAEWRGRTREKVAKLEEGKQLRAEQKESKKKTFHKRPLEANAEGDVGEEKRYKVDQPKRPAERVFALEPDETTAFVSNLPFQADDAKISDFFKDCGPIKEIRLVRDKASRSRGFAYVEFQTAEGLANAVQRDKERMLGRTIGVAQSRPPAENYEPCKVFVLNLGNVVGEQDLLNLFASCGKVKTVRMVLGHDGEPRGFAYVEFEEDVAWMRSVPAAVRLDGAEIGGHKLHITRASKQKGGRSSRVLPTATSTSVAAFLPHVLRQKVAIAPSHEKRQEEREHEQEEQEEEKIVAPVVKSNADFRKFLK